MRTGFHALPRDLAYSLRMMIKRPGFTLAAVAVLALGIGANTAIFSLVNVFLLKPLPVRNPRELTGVFSRDTKKLDSYRGFSYPNYSDLRVANRVFTDLAAHNMAMIGVTEGETTRRLFADIVSSNYFQTLGVSMWRGRPFSADEERPGSAPPVTIVSYSWWKKNGADPHLLGKTVRVNGRQLTVTGITPQGFTGTTALASPELYLPLGMYEAAINDFSGGIHPLAARDNDCLMLFARFRPGMTQENAERQLAPLAKSMEAAFPAENKNQGFIVRPLSRLSLSTAPSNDNGLMIPATLLLCMAAVVLLIAALNVANMMLARGTARRKEIAVRLALGGGRASIVQQLFLEGLMLAVAGAAVGLFLSFGGTQLMVQSMSTLAPVDLVFPSAPDVRVLGATIGFCLLATVLFGFFPAWNLSRPNLVSDLRASDNADMSSSKGRLWSRRNLLVIAQVSLSLVLLTSAGLFIRSSGRVAHADPGFRLDHSALVEFDASLAGYDETHARQLYATVRDRLKSLPGVESVSLAATVPFGTVSLGRSLQTHEAGSKPQSVSFNVVGEDYFHTLGIPILRGRSFQPADASPSSRRVAVLDKVAASKLWPNQDALGKHVRLLGGDGGKDVNDMEVIGVVGNVLEHIGRPSEDPHLYLGFGQQYLPDMHLHLRTASLSPEGEARLLANIRQEIRAVDGRLPVLALKTMRGHIESSADYWVVNTGARLFSLFGGIALLLAVIGLYGVRAYSVARRTREIGIRMALGASSAEAQGMVLREGLKLMTVGTGIGLVLSLLVGKLLAGMLFQVSGADPVVFASAVLLLGAVSVVACYFPARRAARIDPMVALRYE